MSLLHKNKHPRECECELSHQENTVLSECRGVIGATSELQISPHMELCLKKINLTT